MGKFLVPGGSLNTSPSPPEATGEQSRASPMLQLLPGQFQAGVSAADDPAPLGAMFMSDFPT